MLLLLCAVLCRAVSCKQTVSPHILVFWRPEVNQFRAFMVKEAAPGKPIATYTGMLLPGKLSMHPWHFIKVLSQFVKGFSSMKILPSQNKLRIYQSIHYCSVTLLSHVHPNPLQAPR